MQPCDIVKSVFQFKKTDVVPFWCPMENGYDEELDAYYGCPQWRDMLVPYIYGCLCGFKRNDLGNGTFVDRFGVVFRQGNITHIEQTALESASLNGYAWPHAEELDDWERVASDFKAQEGAFRWCGLGLGLYERAWHLRGMEALLVDMIEAPSFVEELLNGVLEIHKQAVKLVAENIPCEAYFGGDDWAGQQGPMMGIELWRKYFKPRLRELINHTHNHGLPFVCHTCGNVSPLIEDLIEIGLDSIESLQPEAMDIIDVKRRATGRMVLVGGVGAQSVLSFGTPDEVRQETERVRRELSRGSGYILAPSKPFMHGIPPANALSFIEAAANMDGSSFR